MNELVRYHNFMNALVFREFEAADFDFLMFLCAQMKDQSTNSMTFSLNEIKTVTGYDYHATKAEFSKRLESMNEKLMRITAKVRDGARTIMFVLFPTFIIDEGANTLTVAVNEQFRFILNELTKNFTQFELKEFTELNSKYSKTLYRLLKQFRSTGEYHVQVDELRKLLGCPESYENKYFMTKIIMPAVADLQKEFPGLTVETIRARTKGRPATGYHFSFEVSGQIRGQMAIDEAAEGMRKYKQLKATGSEKRPQGEQRRRGKRITETTGMERSYSHEDMTELTRKLAQMN